MPEIWTSVCDYEGIYEVSNYGNVRSLDRVVTRSDGNKRKFKGQVLKKIKDKQGYLVISMHNNSTPKSRRIHRLVAEAFIPNPLNKRTINHIDGNKTNNRIDNLEWATQSENTLHAYKNRLKNPSSPNVNKNLQGERHGMSKLKESDVLFIRMNCKKNGGLLTDFELATKFDVNRSVINSVINRRTWKHIK